MYKCMLNELCQKRGFESPKYSYLKYGQDHNPLYQARVIVNDSTFKSSSAFKNHKSADDDAAEIASSHFLTFSRPIDFMHKTKKRKRSSLSSSSNLNTGALNETGETCLTVLPNDEDTKFVSFRHSLFTVTETNCIKSVVDVPNPITSTDAYLLRNKMMVFTGIPG